MSRMLLTIIAWLLLALPLQAAEESDDLQEATEPVTAAQPDTGESSEPEQEAADTGGLTEPSDENFVPTVQVSEDQPVAFPVDI